MSVGLTSRVSALSATGPTPGSPGPVASNTPFVDATLELAPAETDGGQSQEGDDGHPQSDDDRLAAFKEAMKRQVSRAAITVPHTSVTKEELQSLLEPMCNYVRVGLEFHKEDHHIDGQPDEHLHAFIQLKSQKRLGQIYEVIDKSTQGRKYGRVDVRQLATNTDAAKWNNYVKKDGDFIDCGELKLSGAQPQGNFAKATYADETYKEFLTIAKRDGEEAALMYAAEELPREYCTRLSQLRDAALSVKPPRQKYKAPSMAAKDVKLRPWQEHFIKRVMDKTPKRRRIHWVYSSPGHGKSFVHDYLEANHPMGVFNCTDRCGINDLAFQYDEEGIAMWDFPKNFDWDTMEATACSVIEKFSDFGTKLRSLKYKGKNPTALCHVVVFSNRRCPQALKHRDIVEFDVDAFLKASPTDTLDLLECSNQSPTPSPRKVLRHFPCGSFWVPENQPPYADDPSEPPEDPSAYFHEEEPEYDF